MKCFEASCWNTPGTDSQVNDEGCRVGNSKALSGRSVNTDAEQSWLCMPHGHTRWWSTSFRRFSISAKMSLADSKQISRKCLCTSLIRNTNNSLCTSQSYTEYQQQRFQPVLTHNRLRNRNGHEEHCRNSIFWSENKKTMLYSVP